jgi:SPX domain protein involved in polyphosphate accumulation
MILTLKELIVLKEKLKNTYAYQNSRKLKMEEKGRFVERTENDLVYDLVKFLEQKIDFETMKDKKLNDKVSIILKDFKDENIQELNIPQI